MTSVWAEEKFQARLARLAALPPAEKRKRAKAIDKREERFAESHREMSRQIFERRTFEETFCDEERED